MIAACAVVLVVAALFYTLFIRAKDVPDPIPVSPIQHLDDRKHAIYDNLRDLQFEYRLGKLTDQDYQQTKQALQKELALVLSETEQTLASLGLASAKAQAKVPAKPVPPRKGTVCPHCGAAFKDALNFCGKCGKAIA